MQGNDLYRLANVAGLDVKSKQHTVALVDALEGVDATRLIEYVRQHRDGITYSTKVERLDILMQRFRRQLALEANADKLSNGERFITELVNMVGDVRSTLKNSRAESVFLGKELAGFRHIKRDGVRIFSVKQLNALASVGSTDYIIERSETGHLTDDLTKSLVRNILTPPHPAIENQVNKVMGYIERSLGGA